MKPMLYYVFLYPCLVGSKLPKK